MQTYTIECKKELGARLVMIVAVVAEVVHDDNMCFMRIATPQAPTAAYFETMTAVISDVIQIKLGVFRGTALATTKGRSPLSGETAMEGST
jgi:hypothetical protein